jgi:katanin p60 ATPase-containing subunit A1
LLLLQVQDTIAVCASQLSQHIALAALQQGGTYLHQQLSGLQTNQAFIEDALTPLGSAGHGWVGGEGAIYYWAKLPPPPATATAAAAAAAPDSSTEAAAKLVTETAATEGSDAAAAVALAAGDEAVVEWLIQEHGVCIIPGSACGAPGYVRVAFANLQPEQCKVAAGRLKAGFEQLVRVSACAAVAATA